MIKRKRLKFSSDDFNSIDTNDILDIHKYSMKKNIIRNNVWVSYENISFIIK